MTRTQPNVFTSARNLTATLTLLAAAGALLTLPGCVRRTLTITTAPQNARVVLNDEAVGTSPVSVDFTWYGDYDVIIRKEGYETLTTHQRIDPPWYQWPIIDFIAEVLVPFHIHDQQTMHFDLQPAQPIAEEQLIEDARNLRERALFESPEGNPPPITETAPAAE